VKIGQEQLEGKSLEVFKKAQEGGLTSKQTTKLIWASQSLYNKYCQKCKEKAIIHCGKPKQPNDKDTLSEDLYNTLCKRCKKKTDIKMSKVLK